MTSSKWAVTATDTSAGVVDVAEFVEATLEIFQDCDQFPGPTRLCTIVLKGPAPRSSGDALPWSLAWADEPPTLCGPVPLTIADVIKIESFTRDKHPALLVRDRGGKDLEKDKPAAERLRGGYAFAPADLDDAAYLGHASVKRSLSIASVELVFAPAGKTRHRLYFVYPAPARQTWMYDQHSFKLSLVLTCGEQSGRADGPTVVVPAYEFIHDPPGDALKANLKAEYGTPAKTPPLYARDYAGLIANLSPISLALRGLLPLVVGFINSKIEPGQRYTLSAAELACTLLSDGALDTIRDAIAGKLPLDQLVLSGHEDLDMDSFINAYEADQGPIRVFTFDQLRIVLAAGRGVADLVGEQATFEKFTRLPLPLALYAVAALYGQAKHMWAQDVADPKIMGRWAVPADELPLHVQFFWATIYYRAGFTSGRGTLGRRGLEYHDLEWPHEDDPNKYAGYEKYQANWRTASFRVLAASLGVPSLPGLPQGLDLPGIPGVGL